MGFRAGDVNLYRFVGNNPANFVDPTGLFADVAPPPRPVLTITEGEDEPPDYRKIKAPSTTYNGKVYQYQGTWDAVRFTNGLLDKVVFKNQRTTTADGKTLVEDAEVRAWGTRRFAEKIHNDSGDHVAYVVVQVRFFARKCVDDKKKEMELPDRWKQIEFSLHYGVFLRSARPPALDTEAKKITLNKGDMWDTFVDRFIAIARAIKDPTK